MHFFSHHMSDLESLTSVYTKTYLRMRTCTHILSLLREKNLDKSSIKEHYFSLLSFFHLLIFFPCPEYIHLHMHYVALEKNSL